MLKVDLVYERLTPLDAIGIPLVEIDPKVSSETFCIATQNWDKTFIHRFTKAPSLFLFHPYNKVRRAAIAFTTHFAYDFALIVIVLGNLFELAIPEYLPSFFKRVSLLFYLFEAIFQSISRGFLWSSYSYLRNPWMCFDFIITVASLPFAEIVKPSKFELQSLRGIRIFDVMTHLPGIRMMGEGVIKSIHGIIGVTLLFFCFVTSMAIVAKHIFSGIFLNKCVKEPPPNLNISYAEFIKDVDNRPDGFKNEICGNVTGSTKCPAGSICLPNISTKDIDIFSSFVYSFVVNLSFVTHKWYDLTMIDKMRNSTGDLSAIFYIPVIFVGSYCILNLMLVVVITTYEVVASAQEANYQELSTYTYHSSFQFDVSFLHLYPLQTNKETLRKVFMQRDDLLSHQESVQQTWEVLKSLINLSQNVQEKNKNKNSQKRVIITPKNDVYDVQAELTSLY